MERGEARAQPVGIARVPADRHKLAAEKTHGALRSKGWELGAPEVHHDVVAHHLAGEDAEADR